MQAHLEILPVFVNQRSPVLLRLDPFALGYLRQRCRLAHCPGAAGVGWWRAREPSLGSEKRGLVTGGVVLPAQAV